MMASNCLLISAFFNPHDLQNIDIGLGISLFSGIVNYVLARVLIKKGTALHSSTPVDKNSILPWPYG